jgi:aryl sulfotransferase
MKDAAAVRPDLPVVEHVYQNHHFDSLRWNFFRPREDDIVIATSYKAGTTWMQGIVASLIFAGEAPPASLGDLSPWLDMRSFPLELVLTGLEGQAHRRFIKTHLPLDGLPFDPAIKYIFVARDARDVFMSLWNHYRNFPDTAFAALNTTPGRVGPEFSRCPDDIHEFWRGWITRGWFEWETEGYPYWSHLRHAQSWWNYRGLPNILLVHYADLLADLEGEIRRIADFLEIAPPKTAWPAIVGASSFAAMRAEAEKTDEQWSFGFNGGAKTFFNKGTNGRWREVLSDDELALYDDAAKRELTADCRHWLENGGRV